jgi:hypothetical protein
MDAIVLIRPHRRNESLGQISSDESLTCEPQLAFTSTVNGIQANTPARLVASRTAGADCGLTLRGQAFPRDQFHLLAEKVELVEGGVNVGRDPNTLEFFMDNRDGEDVVLVE